MPTRGGALEREKSKNHCFIIENHLYQEPIRWWYRKNHKDNLNQLFMRKVYKM